MCCGLWHVFDGVGVDEVEHGRCGLGTHGVGWRMGGEVYGRDRVCRLVCGSGGGGEGGRGGGEWYMGGIVVRVWARVSTVPCTGGVVWSLGRVGYG